MRVTAIKGFADILPDEAALWQLIEQKAREVFAIYNFFEIRIPIVEKTELFSRSLGETTDIVEKEMYTFADQDEKGSLLTLRPEGTAGVVRAYVETEMYKVEPVRKLYYLGPMFRRERPQKGRMRQFHQIGAEALGRGDPFVDAEMLLLLRDYFDSVGLQGTELQLNSLGCKECRPLYRERLLNFLTDRQESLCANCRRRIQRNPLRVLDCKEPGCIEQTRGAPSILDSLCAACSEHFSTVQGLLSANKISYALNSRMVRGLDYYYRTTFEWTSNQLGSQNAVAAGGRYDGLVEELNGPPVPGVGFALGIERLMLLLRSRLAASSNGPFVYIAWVGDRARQWSFSLVQALRREGLAAEMEGDTRSLKSQMRRADKMNAANVLIAGDDEFAKGRVVLRNMRNKQQEEISLANIQSVLLERKGS